MKVSREHAAENREKILVTAAKLFLERGFDGIGVADLMKTSGLTHGGFYGHFSSKEDLIVQACLRADGEFLPRALERKAVKNVDHFKAFVEDYLSTKHRDNVGIGCPMVALGTDVSRQSLVVRQAFTIGFNRIVQSLMQIIPVKNKQIARERTLLTLASLVGAQVIARAVDDATLSEEVLQAVLKQYK